MNTSANPHRVAGAEVINRLKVCPFCLHLDVPPITTDMSAKEEGDSSTPLPLMPVSTTTDSTFVRDPAFYCRDMFVLVSWTRHSCADMNFI